MMNQLITQLPVMAGIAGGMAVKRVISAGYKVATGNEPPLDPEVEETTWRQAIMWTAVMAAGAAVGSLVSRYIVNQQLHKRIGETLTK